MLTKLFSLIVAAAAVVSVALITTQKANAGGTCHEGNGVTEQRGTIVELRNNCFNATVTVWP